MHRASIWKQKEMSKPVWRASSWKQSKEWQGRCWHKRDKKHHGSGGILVVEIESKVRQGHAAKVIIVGVSKPVQKGNDFLHWIYHKGSIRGGSARGIAAAGPCRDYTSSSRARYDK